MAKNTFREDSHDGSAGRGDFFRNRNFNSSRTGYGRPDRYNRYNELDMRYGLNYDSGRGRFNADNGAGYANTFRSHDRDWDNGRNTYWRERYHHQGHDADDDLITRFGERVRDTWSRWFDGDKTSDRKSHRRGYSSNFRDEGWEL
jgi:hypothetical protein